MSRSWVGQPIPSGVTQAATATADSYTYGAASKALSEGQAMSAWADLAKQQGAYGKGTAPDAPQCPSGWLFAPPDGQTCVNANNVHIAPGSVSACASNASDWPYCSVLPLWFQLRVRTESGHANGLLYVVQNLPTALRDLDLLRTDAGYGWENLKSHIHALARWINLVYYGKSSVVESEENALLDLAATVYKAEATPGPKRLPADSPKFRNIAIAAQAGRPSVLWLAALAAGGYALYKPALAASLYRKVAGLVGRRG